MNWKALFDFLEKHMLKSVTLIGVIAFVNFGLNLLSAAHSGPQADMELHKLLAGSDGFQTIMIGVMMIFLNHHSGNE